MVFESLGSCQQAELCPPPTTDIREENENVISWYTVTVSSSHSDILIGIPRFPLNKSSCQKCQHKQRITVPGVCETELNTWFQATRIRA